MGQLEEHKNDQKSFWTSLKNVMPTKSVTKSVREVVNPLTGKLCTGKESVEVINSFFTNIGPNLNDKLPASSDPSTLHEAGVSLVDPEPLSNEDVAGLIKNVNIYKSSGIPDTSSKLLKDGFLALIEQLTFTMNLSLKTGIFPDVWKVATVRPIPKTGDLTNVNNIRPISLTALPGKLLEKYIHSNLVCFLEDNKLLCKSQGGFRKNRSTTQTVYQLVNDVANAKNDSKLSLAIDLDIAKAFDSINNDYLLRKLHMIGIRGMYLKWLKSYMTDRKQIVQNENYESTERKVSCGVPQGSILGPLLFIIHMNDLSKLSLTSNVLLFADDTVVYYSNKCVKTLYNTVQRDLDMVINWCSFNKLCINSNKTKATFFGKSFSRSYDRNLSLYILGDVIKHVERHEYLGIIIDDKLSFKYHNVKCSSRASNKMYQLRKIRGCITTKCALTIYKTMVLPLFEYGGLFLDSCTAIEQTKMQRLQNQALRITYKQDNYANVYNLHNTATLLPLKLRREIALSKIMFNQVQDNEGLQLRELSTRAHDGPVM